MPKKGTKSKKKKEVDDVPTQEEVACLLVKLSVCTGNCKKSQVNMIISCIKTAVEAIAGFNECVTFSQWFRSLGSGSEGTEKQELKEDDVLKLQNSFQCLQDDVLKLQYSFQCLQETLPAMYTFIDRVEWRSHEKGVPELLPILKAVVYDAEDLLEDFRCYEQKVKIEGTTTSLESGSKFFQDFDTKLKAIKDRLDRQADTLKTIGLDKATLRFDTSVRPVTTSFPTEEKIFGRDNEIKELIRLLGVSANDGRDPSRPKRKRNAICSSASNHIGVTHDSNETTITTSVQVLPIVGIGGVGKTTLAQTICSHPQVKSHFDVIVWVCVSDDFDVKRLTKEAIEQFSGKASTKDNLNSLQYDLADSINERRFLIVLDDMWSENRELWKRFCAPFKHVLEGSMMLVTTRSGKVSDIVRTMDPYLLEGLRDNVFQNFFKLCVFGSESDSSTINQLEQIGKKIIPKLKGSPLAAKTLGRLLGMSLDPAHWNMILNSQLWELEQESTDILPALRLSYMYLPFHLKRCFSFCAVYPKDYNFVKEDLAEIWMAEGFVESQYNIPLQQTALKYFEELAHLSFFQELHGNYVMHDLIHDMAQLVSKDDCFIIKEKKDFERIPQKVRHLSVLQSRDVEWSDLENLCKQTKLRTILCNMYLVGNKDNNVMEKWCAELLCMRVMVCASISKSGLPDSISNMKNLRYLKIKDYCSFDSSLPAAFCHLYNLQLFSARGYKIKVIPRGFGNLINLQKFESKFLNISIKSLELQHYPGEHLPSWFHSSAVLSPLTKSKVLGCSSLSSLEQFLQPTYMHAIKKMVISDCTSLESLPLEWFGCFPILEELEVRNCPKINSRCLQAPSLKKLLLDNSGSLGHDIDCCSLTTFHLSNYYLATLTFNREKIPLLTNLTIHGCSKLETLNGDLPALEELEVRNCPKINSRCLQAPFLKKLLFHYSGSLGDNIDCCSLTTFHLSIYHLASITFNREKIPLLTDLTINDCSKLETLNGGWSVLKSLTIQFCPCLKWENGIVLPSSLQKLYLVDCGYFTVSCLENLASLESLSMVDCKHIEKIPRDLWSSNLNSLQELKIEFCVELVSIGGPEAIAHIPNVHIRDCPNLRGVQQPLLRGWQ